MKNFLKNHNKDNGLNFENRLKAYLIAKGWYCIRSAASKSLIDLVAIKKEQLLLIQCKSTISNKLPKKIVSNKEFMAFGNLDINFIKLVIIYSKALGRCACFYWSKTNHKWILHTDHIHI